jgi:hypothetical protein
VLSLRGYADVAVREVEEQGQVIMRIASPRVSARCS